MLQVLVEQRQGARRDRAPELVVDERRADLARFREVRDRDIELELVDERLDGADVEVSRWLGEDLWAGPTDREPLVTVRAQLARREPPTARVPRVVGVRLGVTVEAVM